MNTEGLKQTGEVEQASTDLKARAEERQSASKAQRRFSPAPLFPPSSSRPPRAGGTGVSAAALLRHPRGGATEMAPSEMAPAGPLRGGAGSGRAAATTTRPRGASPSTARADTKEVPGGSKPGAAGRAGSALGPRALRPPPKAARPR